MCNHKHRLPSDCGAKTENWRINRELAVSLAAGFCLALGWIWERFAFSNGASLAMTPSIGGATLGFYLASYALGGWDLVVQGGRSLWSKRFRFDIDLLMLLAALGAAALGEFAEGALLLFLFSLAHALEHLALNRARKSIKALGQLAPAFARVLRDGSESEIAVEAVSPGDVVVVRPGERIPVDGRVLRGRSAVDQAPITGESIPVDKAPGAEVFAGTLNGQGDLEIATTAAAGDRTLDRVIRLVESAQSQKAPTQLFAERFERVFVPLVLIAAGLMIVVPPLLNALSWSQSFYRAMAMLVGASPCALALGTPATVLAGIARAARQGVLIKGGAHLETLAQLQAIAFDKTGTLTIGKPQVTELAPYDGTSDQELLRVAAAAEKRSPHPLAQAVAQRAEAEGLELPTSEELENLSGRGIRTRVEGETVEIGSARLWEENGIRVPDRLQRQVAELKRNGRSVMIVRHGERWLGALGLSDPPRPGVRLVLDRLRGMGIRRLTMLTGDNLEAGQAVAAQVGADDVRAGLLPEDKSDAIGELERSHHPIAMVGDGVNDAPALARASVGIAMGAAGSAVALETADIALMADDLGKLPFAIGLGRAASRIIRQNLAIALGVIAILVIASAVGGIGLGLAVVVHEGSTLVVVANALRLLAFEPTGKTSSPASS